MHTIALNEIEQVAGGVDQATAIGGNLAIAGIGVGLSSHMAATGLVLSASGVGIVAGLTLVSIALTASYLSTL